MSGPSSRARVAVLVLAAIAYAIARVSFGQEYRHAPWSALVDLSAPRPFGHRVLVPLLVRAPVARGVDVAIAFGVVEALASFLLLVAIARVLALRFTPARAQLFALAFLPLLALVYIVPRAWPIFYPWDTPALAVIAAGVAASARGRHGLVVALTALGALNRESAVLLPIALVCLRIDREPDRRALVAFAAAALAAFIAVRLGIALALPDNPGPSLHFTVHERYRLLDNLAWLVEPAHALALFVTGGFVVLPWPLLARRIAWPWRRLALPAMLWAAAAMLVANVYEPRAFGEAVLLLGVAFAAGHRAQNVDRSPHVRRFDAVAGWVVLACLLAVAFVLARVPVLPVSQWPMPSAAREIAR